MTCWNCGRENDGSVCYSCGFEVEPDKVVEVVHGVNCDCDPQYTNCPALDEADQKPYSEEDYEEAKKQGLDLDDWDDYVRFYHLGEEANCNDM